MSHPEDVHVAKQTHETRKYRETESLLPETWLGTFQEPKTEARARKKFAQVQNV